MTCQKIRKEMSGHAYEDQVKVSTGLPSGDLTGVKEVVRKNYITARVYDAEDR